MIHPQVIIEGDSRIGGHCEIHSWSRLVNVEIGDECKILNSCVIVSSKLTARNTVGPFAHLVHAELAEEATIAISSRSKNRAWAAKRSRCT